MQAAENWQPEAAVDLAREALYRYLAMALSDPTSQTVTFLTDPLVCQLTSQAAELLRHEAAQTPYKLGPGELPPERLDLEPLLAELPEWSQQAVESFGSVFGLVCNRECPPYETEYQSSKESFFRAQQLADIAGFYRAFGIEPANSQPERPDCLSLELEFMAFLLMKKLLADNTFNGDESPQEHARICARAERTFFQEHLYWWAVSFAQGLRRKSPEGWYVRVAELLAAFLPFERARLDVPPVRLPLQPAFIERPEEQAGCAECVAN
jgi:TorA maturation chaperone TorD